MNKFFAGRDDLNPAFFWTCCLGICIVAFALRMPTLASRSLWLDEAYSAWFATRPLYELWHQVPLYESHPPMYYTLLKGWISLFGTAEATLRMLSVLASMGTVLLVSLSGKVLRAGPIGDRVSLLAAFLLAINNGNIQYAQQARPYALETLTATAAILFSLLLLRSMAIQNRQALNIRPMLPILLGLAATAGATLWLHNTAIFVVFGIWFALILSLLIFVPGNRFIQALLVAIPGVIALALWSPFLKLFLEQSANVTSISFWVVWQRADLYSAWMLAAGGEWPFIPAAILGFAGFIALWRIDRSTAFHLGTILVLPLSIILSMSYFLRPIYIARLFEWMAPLVLAFVALGIMVGLRNVLLKKIAAVLIVALCLFSTYKLYTHDSEDWRSLVDTISEQARLGDLVILSPSEIEPAVQYYAKKYESFPDTLVIPSPFPALGFNRTYIGNLGAPVVVLADQELVRKALQNHKRVWLIERNAVMYDSQHLIQSEVSSSLALVKSYRTRQITLNLFE